MTSDVLFDTGTTESIPKPKLHFRFREFPGIIWKPVTAQIQNETSLLTKINPQRRDIIVRNIYE